MSGKNKKKGLPGAKPAIVLLVAVVCLAMAVPYMRGRTADKNKWAEGKATAGSIRTAADNYISEKGKGFNFSGTTLNDLGFSINPNSGGGDLDGKYFTDDSYGIIFTKKGDYLITIDATLSKSGDPPVSPRKMTLDRTGKFSEKP